MSENKEDFIGKRVNDSGKIFQWIKDNPLAFLCTFLTVTNITFIWLFIGAKNENIGITNDLNKQIQDEIRAQVPGEVKKQISPIKQGVDEIKNIAIEVNDKVRKDSAK
ncbi:hypothetical protein [Sphingobacterium hungaricum]|uniref:Uncharacterized protein n=1 Tax=Sphingobacterium hungaricum TaxID=2082723 RepID=A0A928UWR4_9SPHI|nr:hypothetical protein [Sphingobacterium hungaricum]MBE8712524.1 hypothetical protein [Sphingobacterium hungaricum]